jgi:hypothetical protein
MESIKKTRFYTPKIKGGYIVKEGNDWNGAATVMQSLANFSFYCGVGHHTTIGMGQSRVLSQISHVKR